MSNTAINPATKRKDLPALLSTKQVRELADGEYYPAFFYNAMLGLKRPNAALLDYEKGIIDPDEVRFRGAFRAFRKRHKGEKPMIMIAGRELKRIWKDGRQIGAFSKCLERMAG